MKRRAPDGLFIRLFPIVVFLFHLLLGLQFTELGGGVLVP